MYERACNDTESYDKPVKYEHTVCIMVIAERSCASASGGTARSRVSV